MVASAVRLFITASLMLAATFLNVPAANADPVADAEVSYCRDMASLGHLADCVTLVSYGRGVCIQFDRGFDWYTILKRLDAATMDRELSADILVAAVADICPWNQSKKP